ncbi:MAG TPA: dCTP deaminase [Thermoanaerobaculia bacterium]
MAYDFISKSPKDLAQAISQICDFLSKAAVAIFSQIDWTDPESVTVDVKSIQTADLWIQRWTAHLRFVQGSRTERLPWGIIPSFEQLASRLVPDRQVMLRPDWDYNYTVILADFRKYYLHYLREFQDALPHVDIEEDVLGDLKYPFHVIAFPSLERENILLHTLLGHEIGHLFAERFLTDKRKDNFKRSIVEQIEEITDQELQHEEFTESKPGTLFYEGRKKDRQAYNAELAEEYWARALEEILSDIVGAILFGPAALFSTLEMACQQDYDIPPSPGSSFYPPWRTRLREVLNIIEMGDAPFFPINASLFRSRDAFERAERVNEKYGMVKRLCQETSDIKKITARIARLVYGKLGTSVREGTVFLIEDCGLGKRGRRATAKRIFKNMAALIDRLDHDIPPNGLERSINDRTQVGLVEIINAAWFHRVSLVSPVLTKAGTLNEKSTEQRKRANRLTLKAIEFAGLAADYWKANRVENYYPERKAVESKEENQPKATADKKKTIIEVREAVPSPVPSPWAGALSASEIVVCMERDQLDQRLIVTPMLNPKDSFGAGAVDVRLGNEFIIMKREAFPLLDVGGSDTIAFDIERYQEKIIKPYGKKFILHPRQLVIGSTLEYVQLPPDLMCYVIGKSTWGRMGLIIATATKVDPGFRGCITLEIVNEGEIPLVLYPGVRIAQLVLHRTSGKNVYDGDYSCAIGPEFPKFGGNKDAWWTRVRRNL